MEGNRVDQRYCDKFRPENFSGDREGTAASEGKQGIKNGGE